jgi:cytochrome P450
MLPLGALESRLEVSKRPETFLNAPGIVLATDEQRAMRESGEGLAAMRTIIEMDPPEHRSFRKVASPWFTPRAMKRLDDAVRKSARTLIDELAAAADSSGTGECDFATQVATAHPLRILSTILGIPGTRRPTSSS